MIMTSRFKTKEREMQFHKGPHSVSRPYYFGGRNYTGTRKIGES